MRTAIGLMAKDGYEGTSTRDIASAAGVSVAALYYHFPSKLDVLREFLQEAHQIVLDRLLLAIEETGPDPRERLDVAVSTILWSNLHDEWARKAAHVAWREHGRLAAPDRKIINRSIEQMVDAIEQVIAEGVADGTFRTTEPGDVARAVLTLCISVVDPFPAIDRSMAKVIEQHQRFAAALADTEPIAVATAANGQTTPAARTRPNGGAR
jgi:AcrR family transcriptional regulator